MRGIFLFALVTALVGCGNQKPTSQVAGGSAGIVNGSNVTAPNKYSKHTVFIQTQTAAGGGICTGSILDSQTILTAAHCVVGARQAVIVFATNVQDPNTIKREQIRVVDLAATHPGYNPGPAGEEPEGQTQRPPSEAPAAPRIPSVDELAQALEENNVEMNDVAIVHFTGGLPAGYAPVQLPSSETVMQLGAPLHMIGYGLARVASSMKIVDGKPVFVAVPDGSTTGQLRETETPVSRYSTKTKLIFTSGVQTSVCSGDSGGPGFVTDRATGQVVQVGIAVAVATEYCNSVSMHIAVFSYLDWIQGAAAKLAEQATQNTVMF